MPETEADYDALIDAQARLSGLTIDPAWRPAIRQHLVALAAAMQAVDGFVLPDEIEPAPVFQSRAGRP